ncbi:Putative NADPH-quinone reductase (modulator of drug activity B) [Flexibacter flexilis DSM 6793]|uniref:Putative NADPH-quinone reductase (Modulator of drug activity B) n=1 Tax=Flexibacter flexilis DSM 6793 TaxID=927664 RepID=A0A1I1EBX0_9BACT|nr:NAD(P)H-dependent oxidoreductase [Flexibacter flexilis]SFB84595.1 Putative NADPH-quinone reductase (modulator of drug activity B) [Flexibacter flexilis DSM 6793]
MKKILVINGHPYAESFNFALAESYRKGAEAAGAHVQMLNLNELDFNPNLAGGYSLRTELEPDLLKAWELIQWAEHLVWVHPVWWGGLPALLKGFIDRLFLPNMAFRYRENSPLPEGLLKGKTARILATLDQPSWYYWLVYGRPSVNQLRKATLEFCGVKPVRVSYFGIVRKSADTQRAKWLKEANALGLKLK